MKDEDFMKKLKHLGKVNKNHKNQMFQKGEPQPKMTKN